MIDPLRALTKGPPLDETLYPPGSRYHRIAIAEIVLTDGRTVRYLRRRFAPDPAALTPLVLHVVVESDRLDNLAAQYLGDPLQSWRIADADGALRMEAVVVEIGRRIRITLPDGVEPPPDA
jgi:hypothetical protein